MHLQYIVLKALPNLLSKFKNLTRVEAFLTSSGKLIYKTKAATEKSLHLAVSTQLHYKRVNYALGCVIVPF